MRNWFRKDKDPEFEIVTNDIPFSTVFRWYLYDVDITDNVSELADALGLSPISEEGETKELEDSEARLEAITPLMPFLYNMAEISASVMSAIHAQELVDGENDIDAEDLEMLSETHTVYKAVALSTLVGTFSTALELGIVESNTVSSGTYDLKGDDNE